MRGTHPSQSRQCDPALGFSQALHKHEVRKSKCKPHLCTTLPQPKGLRFLTLGKQLKQRHRGQTQRYRVGLEDTKGGSISFYVGIDLRDKEGKEQKRKTVKEEIYFGPNPTNRMQQTQLCTHCTLHFGCEVKAQRSSHSHWHRQPLSSTARLLG